MKVFIYRNLHKNTFSIKYKNKVIDYKDVVCVKDVEFVVWQGGYKRFLKTNRKNVHAFVKGTIVENFNINDFKEEIIYNPKINNFFFSKKNNKEIKFANLVLLINGKIFI